MRTHLKIYLSKYALTRGVLEVAGVYDDVYPDTARYGCGWFGTAHGQGREWHLTAEEAADRAEEMRHAKLASLRKQIKKIQAMTFEPRPYPSE